MINYVGAYLAGRDGNTWLCGKEPRDNLRLDLFGMDFQAIRRLAKLELKIVDGQPVLTLQVSERLNIKKIVVSDIWE